MHRGSRRRRFPIRTQALPECGAMDLCATVMLPFGDTMREIARRCRRAGTRRAHCDPGGTPTRLPALCEYLRHGGLRSNPHGRLPGELRQPFRRVRPGTGFVAIGFLRSIIGAVAQIDPAAVEAAFLEQFELHPNVGWKPPSASSEHDRHDEQMQFVN